MNTQKTPQKLLKPPKKTLVWAAAQCRENPRVEIEPKPRIPVSRPNAMAIAGANAVHGTAAGTAHGARACMDGWMSHAWIGSNIGLQAPIRMIQ